MLSLIKLPRVFTINQVPKVSLPSLNLYNFSLFISARNLKREKISKTNLKHAKCWKRNKPLLYLRSPSHAFFVKLSEEVKTKLVFSHLGRALTASVSSLRFSMRTALLLGTGTPGAQPPTASWASSRWPMRRSISGPIFCPPGTADNFFSLVFLSLQSCFHPPAVRLERLTTCDTPDRI